MVLSPLAGGWCGFGILARCLRSEFHFMLIHTPFLEVWSRLKSFQSYYRQTGVIALVFFGGWMAGKDF